MDYLCESQRYAGFFVYVTFYSYYFLFMLFFIYVNFYSFSFSILFLKMKHACLL